MKNVKRKKQEEDFLIIEGRKRRFFKIYFNMLCIISFGVLYFVCRYLKKVRIYIETKACKLSEADVVYIINQFGDIEMSDVKEIHFYGKSNVLANYVRGNIVRCFESQFYRFLFDYTTGKFVIPAFFNTDCFDSSLNRYLKHNIDQTIEELNLNLSVKEIIYGPNETFVKQKTTFEILIENIFSPLFTYIIICVILWINIDYALYAGIIFIISLHSLFCDILRDFKNRKALRELAEKRNFVKVLRGKKRIEIETKYIFPGDLICIEPSKDFFCDAKILKGTIIVDESFLTGEALPICKSETSNNNLIFSGTNILSSSNEKNHDDMDFEFTHNFAKINEDNNFHEVKNDFITIEMYKSFETNSFKQISNSSSENSLYLDKKTNENLYEYLDDYSIGLVISTGFYTTKGKLIRNILLPRPPDFTFYKESMNLIIFVFGMGLLFTFIILLYFFIIGNPVRISLIYSLDLLSCILAPALPTTIWMGANISAARLKRMKIFCSDLERINSAGRTNIVIFDKTGTLTEEGLDVHCIDNFQIAGDDIGKFDRKMINAISTCHSVYELNGECVGDPLDVKMFAFSNSRFCFERSNSAKYRLIEINRSLIDLNTCEKLFYDQNKHKFLDDNERSDSLVYNQISDNLYSQLDFKNTQIENRFYKVKIVKCYDFDNNLRRMSVVVVDNGKHFVYSKGSPESISKILCNIPEDYEKRVREYTLEGYRVLSIAYKETHSININERLRIKDEDGLTFLGFIVFANKLKPVTESVLVELNEAGIKCVMATGDNILTAISVARQSKLVDKYLPIIFPVINENAKNIYDAEWLCVGDEELTFDKIRFCVVNKKNSLPFDDFLVACEGREYEFIKKDNSTYFSFILSKCAIFARMNPDQKKMLVEDFADIDYSTCFCGDGANDCGALKSAEVGIALAQNETTLTSSFTSRITDISSVLTVLKEGRSALVTSISRFKFVFISSFIQYFSLYILSLKFLFLSEWQNMHNDLFIVLPLAFIMTKFKPSDKLYKKRPNHSLISIESLLPLFGTIVIQSIFLIICVLLIDKCEGSKGEFLKCSIGSTAIFFVSSFQNLTSGILYTEGRPHKEPKAKKIPFIIHLVILFAYTITLLLFVMKTIRFEVFDRFFSRYKFIKFDQKTSLVLVILIIANSLLNFYYINMSQKICSLFSKRNMKRYNKNDKVDDSKEPP
ncbi:vacuolar cation-transporting ATPase [Hamiltosporidium magnivora]|uniref:Cation-transporting ATPase n=1 Tax=Hamiltosporidium magnivora TaxID=148818 RepID=A0A4Q9L974_9MICR|nr:vacuolar cation-transporting ATPase [Hamiltosporidium magnivora]